MGSRLEGLDFSNEGVKRVVGLFAGFVSVIASAPYRFLYLNQRIHDYKKRKKRKKNVPARLCPAGRAGSATKAPQRCSPLSRWALPKSPQSPRSCL